MTYSGYGNICDNLEAKIKKPNILKTKNTL